MQAQARTEPRPSAGTNITSSAAAVVAVSDSTWSSIVACADDAVVVGDEDTTDAALHAVGALRGERGQRHEIRVPAWAEAGRVDDGQRTERSVENGDGGEVV